MRGSDVVLIPAGNAMFKSCPMQDCIGLKNKRNKMHPGWVPSREDMFAKWVIV